MNFSNFAILIFIPIVSCKLWEQNFSWISNFEEETLAGRPLRDYKGQDPYSNRLLASIEKVSSIGQPLSLRCESVTKRYENCFWTSPSGIIFDVNEPPLGISTIIDDGYVCQIQIDSVSNEDLGNWVCNVELEGEEQYQEAVLTATQRALVPSVRLPTHAIPERYVLHMTPFIIEDNFTIEGHVGIHFKVNDYADGITVHIRDIIIYENLVSLVNIETNENVLINGHSYDAEREFYTPKTYVEAGQNYILNIPFQAILNDGLVGFYRSTYKR